MKKLWMPVLAVALAVGVSATSFAAQWKTAYEGLLTEPMEATLTSVTDLGADFLVSNEAAPASDTAADAANVTDQNETTEWVATKEGDHLQINFDGLKLINAIHIYENNEDYGFANGGKTSGVGHYTEELDDPDEGTFVSKPPFVIEAWNGEEWVEVYETDSLGGYHLCAIDTIQTNAIRLTINTFREKVNQLKLGEVNATYIAPVQREDEFVNMGYAGKNSWLTRTNSIAGGALDSLTDLVLIEPFSWVRVDPNGARSLYDGAPTTADDGFKVGQFIFQYPNSSLRLDHYADPFSDEVDAMMQKAAKSLYAFHMGMYGANDTDKVTYEDAVAYLTSGEAPRIWICLTGGDIGKSNGGSWSHNMFQDNPGSLNTFVSDVVKFVNKYEWLYGVDIDWEYPATGAQHQDLADMIHMLKAQGIPEVSAAVSPGYPYKASVWQDLDRINIMSYMNAGDDVHHSMGQMNNDINKYMANGCPLNKIVVGVPYYCINTSGDIGNPAPPSFESLYRSYMSIHSDFPTGMNSLQSGAYRMVFNSQNMLRDKVAYCALRGVKGVFNWQQHNDIPVYEPDEVRQLFRGDDSLARATREAIDQFVVNPAE